MALRLVRQGGRPGLVELLASSLGVIVCGLLRGARWLWVCWYGWAA